MTKTAGQRHDEHDGPGRLCALDGFQIRFSLR